ncbi:MAG: YdeR [Candidatus Eremiobacteraeota bacterium]|nr:YdeR [Candidatus Eremiobacteraeota bacterium]
MAAATPLPELATADANASATVASPRISGGLIALFAVACGLAVANLYYAQPLLEVIRRTFGVDEAASGLIVTVSQLGYAAGLLLLAPLGDLFENRRLIVTILCGTVVALVAAAFTQSFGEFLAAMLAIGVTSVVAQVLVPLAATLAPSQARGRIVGQVQSGILLGILLARAVSGILSDALGWRAVYVISAVLLAIMTIVLYRVLPTRRPAFAEGYGRLVASLVRIYREEPMLRRRALYQAAMFGTFSAFWTSITFVLAGPPFHFSETWIGLFALVGAAGALNAPIAGRLGDAGHEHVLTGVAFVLAAGGTLLTLLHTQLWALVVGAVLIDLGVQTTMVLGQQIVFALKPSERGRLNTLYIATLFAGGAVGSAVSGFAYAHAGWPGVAILGAALPIAALLYWLTERQRVFAAR